MARCQRNVRSEQTCDSSLHTNNAASAVTRLVDMGAEPFLVASSLSLLVAQRLLRRPCVTCAEPYLPSPDVLARLAIPPELLVGARPRKGRGCAECTDSGYRGRIGVFELLAVTDDVRATVLKTPTEAAVSEAAHRGGLVTLRQAAVTKAMRGETTFEEVLRTT